MIFRRKYTLEGPAVAALGSLAGGMAAKALGADKGKGPTNGGGIEGLTSSKGQGKDGTGPGYATQVDPSKAISYFQQAAEAQSTGYNQGLNYYDTAIKQAKTEISGGYNKANATLQPLSYSSNQALNEQMRMLGLDPIQATASYGDALQTGYNAVKASLGTSVEPGMNSLMGLLDEAAKARNPSDRQQYRNQILQQTQEIPANALNQLQKQLAELGQAPVNPFDANMTEYLNMGGSTNKNTVTGAQTDAEWQRTKAEYEKSLADYNSKTSAIQQQIDAVKGYQTELSNFGNQFSREYSDEYDGGYTGDQIIQKVTSLPGYQFNLDQGTKAIERQGAAAGMLGSGNTLNALQTFGQGQAQSYYNQYMGYLSGITAQGAPATAQISANQAAEGTALATLTQNYGNAQMDTARANANFLAKTLQDSGILFNNTAMFNASAQNASILQGNQNQAALQQQAIQSGPGYMNAQTNQGQLGLAQQIQGWNQNQSNQVLSGYLGNSGGGYSSGGMNFTDWTGKGWI